MTPPRSKNLNLIILLCFAQAFTQVGRTEQPVYNVGAGQSSQMATRYVDLKDADGQVVGRQKETYRPSEDKYGNLEGAQYDLAVDGAFEGKTVAVIQLYAFDFSRPRDALKEKGFSVYRWSGMPSCKDLKAGLEKASQLWLISGQSQTLTPEHIAAIKDFFDAGHGVYIWGDNQPFYADANVLSEALLGTSMQGNLPGDTVVDLLTMDGETDKSVGLRRDHLITTGIDQLYEGITIATVTPTPDMEPLLYGSAGNLVTAIYDKQGKRVILDGGFTRLYNRWDTAGTARYVKNAATWLVNVERFSEVALSE
jgi:hypothetical protein